MKDKDHISFLEDPKTPTAVSLPCNIMFTVEVLRHGGGRLALVVWGLEAIVESPVWHIACAIQQDSHPIETWWYIRSIYDNNVNSDVLTEQSSVQKIN